MILIEDYSHFVHLYGLREGEVIFHPTLFSAHPTILAKLAIASTTLHPVVRLHQISSSSSAGICRVTYLTAFPNIQAAANHS